MLSFPSPSGWRDQMTAFIGRREFITLLGAVRRRRGPAGAHAQQTAAPVVGWLNSGCRVWARTSGDRIPPGYERDRLRRWPERGDRIPLGEIGQYDRACRLLGCRQVTVIVTSAYARGCQSVQRHDNSGCRHFRWQTRLRPGSSPASDRPGGNITGIDQYLDADRWRSGCSCCVTN